MPKEQKPAGKFVPGWLFGRSLFDDENKYSESRSERAQKLWKARNVERNSSESKPAWEVFDTALENYASPLDLNFKNYLQEKVNRAKKTDSKIRILDLGIGTGRKWLDFIEKNKEHLEFHSSGFTRNSVHPDIKKNFKISSAAKIHTKFPAEHFDIIVSHFGTHEQEKTAFETIVHLLKPEGEAIVTGHEFGRPPIEDVENYERHYEILPTKLEKSVPRGHWGYHIRKVAAKP